MREIRRTIALLVVVLAVSVSLGAVEFEDYGLTVLGERTEDGLRLTTLRDERDREFVFGADTAVGEAEIAIVEQVVNLVYGFDSMSIEELRIVVGERRVSVQVRPREFFHDGIDLGALTPAGVQFYFVDFLEYDFRMLVRGLFLRLRGQFVNEELLLERLVGAAQNPEQFLQSQNPEFMLSRIHELEQELARTREELEHSIVERERIRNAVLVLENRSLFGSVRIPDAAAVQRLIELRQEFPGLDQDDMRARLEAEGFSISKKEVFLVYSLYFNEFE
ncbi:MAG: hypothetical protein EA428_14980 [Spirochaetaceae bacterium]|nr:MAG: hypothetical protein EA428_14980 [Spirochaetaceae bacterium]